MIVPVTVPNGPLMIGSPPANVPMRLGFSLLMSRTSMLSPNGSDESMVFVVIRSLSTLTESAPSLLRSLPLWSLIMNSPPPDWTNCMIAVFSAAVNRMFGSGSTNALKCDRSSALDALPNVIAPVGGNVLRLYRPVRCNATPHAEIAPVQLVSVLGAGFCASGSGIAVEMIQSALPAVSADVSSNSTL
jgi:hypothetical protein